MWKWSILHPGEVCRGKMITIMSMLMMPTCRVVDGSVRAVSAVASYRRVLKQTLGHRI